MAAERAGFRDYLPPLLRSIAAPAGSKQLPSRSHPVIGLSEHFATEDNVNDRGNPFAWGARGMNPPTEYDRFAGGSYGPIPQQDNALAIPVDPHAPRAARTQAYVTPPSLWNLSGIAAGWSDPYKATPGRQPTAQLAFGALGSLLIGGPTVKAPLPTLPEPARMVAPGF